MAREPEQPVGGAGEQPAPELILASTSPARRAIFDALGLRYRAVAPEFEERHDPALSPVELVQTLALGKARAVAARHPGALVVGADQVAAFDGQVWGKPADEAAARAQLQRLRGRTHELVTGVALVGPGLEKVEHEVAHLTVFRLTDAEVDAYLRTGEWQGCAGSYRVEGRGLAIFSEIRGDLNTVRGLPMTRLVRMLRDAGVRFF
jgi:septum formation protein